MSASVSTERLPALMRDLPQRYWEDPFLIRFVESGETREAVEVGASVMGWDNEVQRRLRKMKEIHLNHRSTWEASIENQRGVIHLWHDEAFTDDPAPLGSLELLHTWQFGDQARSTKWLPPLLREWVEHTDRENVFSCGNAVVWNNIEPINPHSHGALSHVTDCDTQPHPETVSRYDNNVTRGVVQAKRGEEKGTVQSLPLNLFTTDRLTVTSSIAAARFVNELVVPIKVFAIREQRKAVRVGEYWDEVLGWVKLLNNPSRIDGNSAYDGEITFTRSYRVTNLTRWQLQLRFSSRSNGNGKEWQLYAPTDHLCSEPPTISLAVDWHANVRDGCLRDDGTTDSARECAQSAPAALYDLMHPMLYTYGISRFPARLTYDLLLEPPGHLADLFLKD